MAPPAHLVLLDPYTGKVRELRRVVPADFGSHDQPGALLGVLRLPQGMSPEEYLERRSELLSLYDRLLPEFAHQQQIAGVGVRQAATRFVLLFRLLREPPIDAYYDAVGHEFFRWVQDSAGEPS